MDATMSMVRDIKLHDDPRAPMRARLDALAAFRHSPDTAQKLLKVYGSEQPWTLTRAPAAKGGQDYLGRLAQVHYVGERGETIDWAEMRITTSLDKAGRNMTARGGWPSLVAEDKDMRFSLRDMRLASKQARGFGDLWFGDAQVDIAGMKVDAKGPGVNVALDDIRLRTAVIARPKSVEVAYGVTVRAISVAGERVDNFRLATRVTNIDKATMLEITALADKREAASGTPEQQLAAITPMLKQMGKAAIKHGTALEIDELSARFHGNTVSLKGRVGLEGAVEADLDSLATLVKKIVAHFDVKVPVAVLRDISTAVAARQASAQANPQPVANIAQTMTDIMVGKAINSGYARMEKDVLVSSIDFRGGVLRINGKELALPSFAPPAGQPPAPRSIARASPALALLQARRIEERCALPDYPQEVVRLDQPLRLTMRFTVGADGALRELALAAPSQYPAYDQAVLAAAASCVYLPALRNGEPVDMPMTWQVVRAPGATRP
jgi:TonB family protein